MKADALATQALADSALYDAGFSDGVASVAPPTDGTGISSDQEQADIAAAIKPLQDQISALQLAKTQEDALLASVQSAVQSLAAILNPAPVVTP